MRRSSSIRCLSAVIGETSVTDENINRHDHDGSPPLAEQSAALNENRIRRRNASQNAARGLVQWALSVVIRTLPLSGGNIKQKIAVMHESSNRRLERFSTAPRGPYTFPSWPSPREQGKAP